MPIGDIRIAKYLKRWYRILNPRQRVLFSTLIKNIRLYINEIKHEDEEYLKAIETYLSFILGKHINRNCLATKYDRDYEKISGTTSYRRPSIQWDHTEVTRFCSSELVSVKKSILKSIEYQ